MSVAERFKTFLSNIALTETQVSNGSARREAVVGVLNSHYRGISNDTANSTYVGSWAKRTRIRPPRDVDVLYTLPVEVYNRFQLRAGNKQSQLLQEVKTVLAGTFGQTAIRGDGPIVNVPFSAYNVELIPAFALDGGGHWVCMTDNGGHYKKADYAAEISAISASNTNTNGNTRDLIKMMKRWQGYCSVPIKSFHIELLATDFLATWVHKGKSATWYDWMVRDFFAYMVEKAGGYVFVPGTYELMSTGTAWKSRAETALTRARKACSLETAETNTQAGEEWQKVFGTDIPKGW